MWCRLSRYLSSSGLTLIELLAAVVLTGVVIAPLLSVLGQSYERTAHQESERRMLFYAEEIMERMRVRDDLASDETVDGVFYEKGECRVNDGCIPALSPDSSEYATYTVTVRRSAYAGLDAFYDLIVEVYPAEPDGRSMPVRLMTVVRR
jgi:Tfp pilus assembly protein PilV